MATTVAELMATLGLDSSNFDKGMDKAETKGSSFQKTMLGLSSVGGGILAAGLATAAGGAVILGKELYNDVQIAMDAEKVQSQLNAVIKSTGGVAGITADKANELATALSQVTMFDDEAVLSGENMLLTFTNIGKDVFPDATETMLDMSQALGQDLQSSAIQLGKALNDPVKGITALQRVGVSFTEEQKTMVEEMVKAGDTMGAQKFILAELQKEFGGSARAAGETFAGRLAILKNTIDNVRESIGARLIPIVQRLIEWFVKIYNSPEFQEFLNKAIDNIIAFVEIAATNIPKFIEGFQKAFKWLADNKPVVIGILATLGVAILAFAVTSAIAIWTAMAPFLPIIAIIVLVGLAAYSLYRIWTENFGGIQEKSKMFFDWLKKTWDVIWAALLPIFEYFVAQFRSLQQAFQAAFAGDWEMVGMKIREIWDRAWGIIKNIASTAWQNIRIGLSNFISNIITKFQTTDWRSIGINILKGIVNGMLSLEGWMKSQITKIAGNIVGFFKGFFGISSPSELMEQIIGKNIALGINEGFSNNLALSPVSVMGEVQAVSSSAFGGVGSNNADILSVLRQLLAKKDFDKTEFAELIAKELAKVI